MTHAEIAEVLGWWSAMFALLGAIALFIPLFHLSRIREDLEDLAYDGPPDPKTEEKLRQARELLRLKFRPARAVAKTLGIAGGVMLFLSLVCAIGQGLYLPERLFFFF